MRFLQLGPLTVRTDSGEPSAVGGKQAVLLAELLAAEGNVVPAGRLVDEIYGGEPPAKPLRALHAQMTRLRRKLAQWDAHGPGPERLTSSHTGYALKIDAAESDVAQFLAEARRGRALVGTDAHEAIAVLQGCLGLWRGPVLDGVSIGQGARFLASRLEEVKLQAVESLIEARIGVGGDAEVVSDLERLLEEHPYHEQLADLLMTCLYRLSRTADALAVYERVRRRFVDDLGIEPNPRLSERFTAILNHDLGHDPVKRPAAEPEPFVRTARRPQEYLRAIADPGTFAELGPGEPGDAPASGVCRVDGKSVAVFARGGRSSSSSSASSSDGADIQRAMEYARRARVPVVGFIDSGEASLEGYGPVLRTAAGLSGHVPQISVVLGPCTGAAAYVSALSDLVVTTGAAGSGNVALTSPGVDETFPLVRRLLGYLPSSCWHPPPVAPPVPAEPMPGSPAETRDVIRGIVDSGSDLELYAGTGDGLITALARVEGMPAGIVAATGPLTLAATDKGTRFVRMCDAYGLPLITLVDTPLFPPGQEDTGARLLYALIKASVPRISVILRGTHTVMNATEIGADAVYAWESTNTAALGPVDAVLAPDRTRHAVAARLAVLTSALEPGFRHDNQPQ
ncbi:Acetyl-CoA carboxylase, carboxyltransferase component [Nonomuraea solani]|uniref:Acetyl-CoA carboxylase, carboxyltransferase component n=1 Tax=Nonomuraea solani TaxID=1144553 RepID=A0A1H6EDX3_9ACTN|nr:carboxyl transferase domain-containing protein [Nonomuraea solani]SEG95453.1 Acetyl-CoA carboxylase, carboxyltransferase component [Nonomuraea solani]